MASELLSTKWANRLNLLTAILTCVIGFYYVTTNIIDIWEEKLIDPDVDILKIVLVALGILFGLTYIIFAVVSYVK